MKTKEQILKWLNEQPWKNEFYEAVFTLRTDLNFDYDEAFIFGAFGWGKTEQGRDVWNTRNSAYRKWYFSNERPMSWEEYCEQNPIKEDDCYVGSNGERCTTMSKDLCKAFLAYMKLIQLRNAWVKDGDENLCRIVWSPNRGFWCTRCGHNGLSFSTEAIGEEFINTFKDLLEIARPLI